MPDPLKFPGVRSSVIPHVGGHWFTAIRRSVVNKFIALGFGHPLGCRGWLAGGCAGLLPSFAAVVRTLNNLAEPAAGLGGVKPVRINGRTFEMINFPASEMR